MEVIKRNMMTVLQYIKRSFSGASTNEKLIGLISKKMNISVLVNSFSIDILNSPCVQYCPKIINPFNINRKVTWGNVILVPLLSISLGTSYTYPNIPLIFQKSLQSSLLGVLSAALSYSPYLIHGLKRQKLQGVKSTYILFWSNDLIFFSQSLWTETLQKWSWMYQRWKQVYL